MDRSKAGSAITVARGVEMNFGKIMFLDFNIAWAETVDFMFFSVISFNHFTMEPIQAKDDKKI